MKIVYSNLPMKKELNAFRYRSEGNCLIEYDEEVIFPVNAVLAKSIAAIGAGVTIIAISIARPDILIPIFVYIAGAVFLIAGIVNLADFIILSRSGIRFGYLGVEVVLLFLLAILLFLFPVFIGSSIIAVFAALICAAGAVSVTCGVFSILMQRRIRTIIRKNEEVLPGHYDE